MSADHLAADTPGAGGENTLGEPTVGRLTLPSADESSEQWQRVVKVLAQVSEAQQSPSVPREVLAGALDTAITEFCKLDEEPRVCRFFTEYGAREGQAGAPDFDFVRFFDKGLPFLVDVALDMPRLFPEAGGLPIQRSRSTFLRAKELSRSTVVLSRRQCACLLAHSFLGSLKRPEAVLKNDFRFTALDLFVGTAVSPESACTFLNYFSVLGSIVADEQETGGDGDGAGGDGGHINIGGSGSVAGGGLMAAELVFERVGYPKGPAPWEWDDNPAPLCRVDLVDGSIDDCKADMHAEFANAFVGGGVMTGDAAMEEILFLVKPELMVAMALQNRMVDEEAVRISGALKFSRVKGFGSTLEFAGDADEVDKGHVPATVCAIDAIRGGGPAMARSAMLRDMNKARVAFDGAKELGTGHWGCGAFGNNHDLMFLKQWMAASDAGVKRMYYHDFDRKQSHHIFPLVRKLKQMTVGQLWTFLRSQTDDLKDFDVASFSRRVADIAVGRIKVPE